MSCSENGIHLAGARAHPTHICASTRRYAILYAIALCASALLLTLAIVERHSGYLRTHFWAFLTADAVVTMFVALEVGVSMVAQGWRRYLTSLPNFLDVIVVLFCVFVILFHLFGPSVRARISGLTGTDAHVLADTDDDLENEELKEEEVETTVLVTRYAAQILRLCVMLRHFKR